MEYLELVRKNEELAKQLKKLRKKKKKFISNFHEETTHLRNVKETILKGNEVLEINISELEKDIQFERERPEMPRAQKF